MHNYDGATYWNADIPFLSLLFLDPEINFARIYAIIKQIGTMLFRLKQTQWNLHKLIHNNVQQFIYGISGRVALSHWLMGWNLQIAYNIKAKKILP